MDALVANYASDSDSDGDAPVVIAGETALEPPESSALLPPPPLDLLQPPNFVDYSTMAQGSRVRSFPHVEGNYALHVYIPVVIPSEAIKHLAHVMERAASFVPDLYAVDADYALSELCKDEQKLEKVLLSREFHVSLGRTVAIQVHQIESLVAMLRQKFRSQRRLAISNNFIAECLLCYYFQWANYVCLSTDYTCRDFYVPIWVIVFCTDRSDHILIRYWMDFNKWEHFINDDCTRSFLSLEVTSTGLPEISKQIAMVDDVYRLHGLPEFYKNPRPHISLAWALGDASCKLKQAIKEIEKSQSSMGTSQKCILRCKFSHVGCKIGKKLYDICKLAD
ncbi:hypothetical protein E2562_017694 [Oryza meyeriana var. granulata]|uniref:U6 snRNA phosphodiesterase n=1 Tax=Oryza meyeriana var. granulata TaxID=110450 RepID=A0A6G1BXU2_9ORYZ|nr:hypothetical protein E2562_017694 [Oryza meyeriana var. granulata]KAF0892726.1 hypothetical protein E2562_017694 [Oryza meyeriana var. granulata]